jgi:chaperone required for assembly of F1-ATPase
MLRFWNNADAASHESGFVILLDGKPMRLPSGAILHITNASLARAIAAEWQQAGGQKGGTMSFADVPLTRLAGTTQERIATDPGPTVAGLSEYAGHDLLCYRAHEPAELASRQQRHWQPWLDWASDTYGARLQVTAGVMPVRQDPQALARLAGAVGAHPPGVLAALGIAVPALGSLILGLALAAFRLSAAEAHDLATLDERFQAELWGEDAMAAARRAAMADDVALAQRFITLSVGGIA